MALRDHPDWSMAQIADAPAGSTTNDQPMKHRVQRAIAVLAADKLVTQVRTRRPLDAHGEGRGSRRRQGREQRREALDGCRRRYHAQDRARADSTTDRGRDRRLDDGFAICPMPSSCRSTGRRWPPGSTASPTKSRRCASVPRKLPPRRPGRRRLWPRPRPSPPNGRPPSRAERPQNEADRSVSEGRILAPRSATGRYGIRPPRIFRIRINDTARYDSAKNRKKPRNSAIVAVSVLPYQTHDTRGEFNPPLLVSSWGRIAVSSLKGGDTAIRYALSTQNCAAFPTLTGAP